MEPNHLQDNEHRIRSIARLYYGLYVYGKQNTDVDLSDLEQAGRIAVFDISQKRAEMLDHAGYVSAAIKYACLNEIRKMRHKVRQVYLAHQHDEMVPIVDLLPTKERGETAPEHLEQMDDLLYHIKQEFSPREADALDSLVQGCRNVYDLNLSVPPSTKTKDRVKIVTALDLDDEEMIIYAQVLTGARARFPRGFQAIENSGRDRIKKYFLALLKAQHITPQEFAKQGGKYDFLTKYRLDVFLGAVSFGILDLLQQTDYRIRREDIPHLPERIEHLFEEKIRELIIKLVNLRGGGDPKKIKNFHFSGEFGYLYNKEIGRAHV